MGIDSLLARLEAESVTPGTPALAPDVTAKPAPALDCTAVTPVTSPHRVTPHASACLWLLHFLDLEPVAVAFVPLVDHGGALAAYPSAIAAEPMPDPPAEPIPPDLSAMVTACEQAGLYDDSDRATMPAMFAADAEGTRALIEDMHSRIGRCRRCLHFRRPGLSEPGYCTEREDLRHVYGFMFELADHGVARCDSFADG